MPGTYEKDQATGVNAYVVFKFESDWGVHPLTADWRYFNVVAGEGLDQNLVLYRSKVIRRDRMRNKDVRGTQLPGGPLPFELAPKGVSQFIYALLGTHTSTAGTGPYTHVLKGSTTTTLPMFTIVKSFTDVDNEFQHILFKGSRVSGMTLDLNVNDTAGGVFDILSREATEFTDDPDFGAPADMTSDPFTSVQVTVYEGSSLIPLGTAQSLNLSVQNGMDGQNLVLGSNFRANLKAGERDTRIRGTFLFNNTDLYNKAVNGTDTAVQIVASDGTYSHTIFLPNVDLLPNQSTPKIQRPGGLTIPLEGVASKDVGQGTDIVWTIVSPESTIIANS